MHGGRFVAQNGIADFWLDQDHTLWPRLFDFDPEPVPDNDGWVRAVHLPIGRERKPAISQTKPTFARWFDPEVFAWRRPEIVTQYGSQRPLDSCQSLDELLNYEANLNQELQPALDALERDALPDAVAIWKEWCAADGMTNAELLLAKLISLTDEARKIAPVESRELFKLQTQLEIALDAARRNGNEDTLAALMEAIFVTANDIDGPEEKVETERRKRSERTEAEDWVRQYGSSRLKKSLEVGLLHKSMGAYRDERLALERSSWGWESDPRSFKEIVNPEEGAIDSLIQARKIDPDVRLVFSPSYGPALLAEFLGRSISKPAEVSGYGYSEEPF